MPRIKRKKIELLVDSTQTKKSKIEKKYRYCCDYKYSGIQCDYATNTKKEFIHHVKRHETGQYKYICSFNNCTKRWFSNKLDLDIDLNLHTNNGVCVCEYLNCVYKTKYRNDFKKHIIIHSDKKPYKCSQCNNSFNVSGNRDRHEREFHTNKKPYPCKECNKWFKTEREVQIHSVVHSNKKPYTCTYNECKYITKRNTCLLRHIRAVHFNIRPHPCNVCDYKSKTKKDLKFHIRSVHKKLRPYKCSECKYGFSTRTNLNKHLSSIHDIGDFECTYCYYNVAKLIKYKCPKSNLVNNICRKCFKKVSGYTSRAEEQMVKYLSKNSKIGNYIVLQNQIIAHHSCLTKRRPDLLISESNKLHILIECDENQHRSSKYPVKCEEGRLNEIFDEFKQGKFVVIRWNPDGYSLPFKLKGTQKPKRKERLIALENLILKIISDHETIDKNNCVPEIYYMYYSEDNPRILTNFKYKLLY